MGTTETGLRYPVGTDFVVDGDDAIHALATDVTHSTWIGAGAAVNIAASAAANSAVTFPIGWFARAPQYVGSASASTAIVATGPATATGATVTIRNISTNAVNGVTPTIIAMLPPLPPGVALAEARVAAATVDGWDEWTITCVTPGCRAFGIGLAVLVPGGEHLDAAVCGTCGQVAEAVQA